MRTVVGVLIGLGGLLPVAGIGWGAYRARRRVRDLSRGDGTDSMTIDELGSVHQYTDLAVVRSTLEDLRGPGIVTMLGIVLGTVGGVWGLYLG